MTAAIWSNSFSRGSHLDLNHIVIHLVSSLAPAGRSSLSADQTLRQDRRQLVFRHTQVERDACGDRRRAVTRAPETIVVSWASGGSSRFQQPR